MASTDRNSNRPRQHGVLMWMRALATLATAACNADVDDSSEVLAKNGGSAEQALVCSTVINTALDTDFSVNHAGAATELAKVKEQSARDLSEPGRIAELGWVYDLERQALRSDPSLQQQFCSAVVTRLAYLLYYGQATSPKTVSLPPRCAGCPETLSDAEVKQVLDPVANGTAQTLFLNRTDNNRYAREAAALNIARIVLSDLGVGSCMNVDVAGLIDPARALTKEGVRAVNQLFFPAGSRTAAAKYPFMTSDGAYKEGPGYLMFTYEAMMPLVYLYEKYGGGNHNLFIEGDAGIFVQGLPTQLRKLHAWLVTSQNEDGTWAHQNDAGPVPKRENLLELAVATFMLNKDGGHPDKLRNDSCGALSRKGDRLTFAQLEALYVPGTGPGRCHADERIRLARRLFDPIEGEFTCGSYYNGSKTKGLVGEALFPEGGQLFLYAPTTSVRARFFNEGSFWVPSSPEPAPDCQSVAADDVVARRTCDHMLVLREAYYENATESAVWAPRTASHKRYNDTHFELRVGAKEVLIGPGQMGYISAELAGQAGYWPYEQWNLPKNYNLTRAFRRYPKSLYVQTDGEVMQAGEKLRLLRATSTASLYRMQTDTLWRYIVWAHQRYFIVVDVPRSASAIYLGSHYHFRSTDKQAPNTAKVVGSSRFAMKVLPFREESGFGTLRQQDSSVGVAFFSALPTDVTTTTVNPEWFSDSCSDNKYAANASENYCRHVRLDHVTRTGQRLLPVLLWPVVDGTLPDVTPVVSWSATEPGVAESVVLRVDYGFGIGFRSHAWRISRQSLTDGSVLDAVL